MTSETNHWAEQLADLSARGLRRSLRTIDSAQGAHVVLDGRRLCNFASNDYLGLANDPRVRSAVAQALDRWGWGAGASPLVVGHMRPHAELEARLAAFKRTQAALVCSTGYQANLAVLGALAGPGDVVFLDKLDHASIIDAAFLAVGRPPAGRPPAGRPPAGPTVRTFAHRDYTRLQQLLKRYAGARRRIIVTDSLFSMDGDYADLSMLVELKRDYNAILCLDEAHATGVLGPHGRGLADHFDLEPQIDLTVGTLSKALGGLGGFIAGFSEIIQCLLNTARSFIYTTALPPAACAAAMAALDIVEQEPQRRRKVLALAERLRRGLREQLGLNIGDSCSHIVPVIVGSAERAVELARHLEAAGILAPAIRPPTVPTGKARVRLSVTAGHDESDIDRLISAVGTFRERRAEMALPRDGSEAVEYAPGPTGVSKAGGLTQPGGSTTV